MVNGPGFRQGDRRGPSPRPQKGEGGAPPQFSAHFYCGQTAGCIKMPLGMEVGLITFRARRSRGEMYIDHGRLCLTVPRHIPRLLHVPGSNLRER